VRQPWDSGEERAGRGLQSSTSQLNLSRFSHLTNPLKTPKHPLHPRLKHSLNTP